MNLFVGIDGSRNRSGGAVAHLVGILSEGDPRSFGIEQIHLWAYKTLLDAIPDHPWLVKHNPKALERSLFHQLYWQRFLLDREAKLAGCHIFLNTDAGTVSTMKPAVTMSRDMLSYEPGEMSRYGFSLARLRLFLLRYVQNSSLRRAEGVIFLTQYAADVIQRSCGTLTSLAFIPHGIGLGFREVNRVNSWPESKERSIRCLYISNAEMYKHQWIVIKAITLLRERGYNLTLSLVGGGSGNAQKILERTLYELDPIREFVTQLDFVPQKELPKHLANADLFVFASSCENMPNTLIEAMAVGLPIACSNRGPMPEILADGGVYFNPEDESSIANAILQIIDSAECRSTISKRAKTLSQQYSWKRCSDQTCLSL